MSQQVTDKVNNYELILENASLNVTDLWNDDLLNTFSSRLAKDTAEIKTIIHESALDELLSPIIASSDSAQLEDDPFFQELLPSWLETGVEKSFNLIPDLELVTSFIKFEERSVIEDAYSGKFADFEPNEDELELSQHNNLNIEMLREQDKYWIHFYSEVYRRDYKYTVFIHAKSQLDSLMQPILSRSQFEEVMLVDAEGSVHYQKHYNELLATSLDSITTSTGELVQASSLRNASLAGDIEIGGTGYKLFSQPVMFPVLNMEGIENKDEQGYMQAVSLEAWTIAGFIEQEQFYSLTRYISISWIILFFYLVFLVLVGLPFIKLWYMGGHERLKRRDVFLLVFCTMLGVAVGVLGLLDITYYTEIKHDLDQKLEAVAAEVEHQFLNELQASYLQLKEFEEKFEEKEDDEGIKRMVLRADTITLDDIPLKDYPFARLTLIDSTGWQRVKWSSGNQATPLIDVSSRAYFNRVRKNNLWAVRPNTWIDSLGVEIESLGTDANRHYELTIEPVFSLNTGQNETIVSIPAQNESVATLSTRFASLFDPVLPLNVGMAIVDDRGNVLYHSDELRNLRENFIAESNNDEALRVAILHGVTKKIDVEYLGQGHRLYITPMDDIPWRLIIFLDKRFVRTVNLHLFSEALFLFSAYLLLMVVLWASRMWWKRDNKGVVDRDRALLWPDEKKSEAYVQVFWGNVTLCVMLFGAILLARAHQLLHLAFLVPLLGVILTYLNLRLPSKITELNKALVDRNDSVWVAAVRLRLRQFWQASILGVALILLSGFLAGIKPIIGIESHRAFFAFWIVPLGLFLAFFIVSSPYTYKKEREEIPYRRYYVFAVYSLVFLFSAMPAICMFKITFDTESKLWGHQQLNHLMEVWEGRKESGSPHIAFSEDWQREIVMLGDVQNETQDSDDAASDTEKADDPDWYYSFIDAFRPTYNDISYLSRSLHERVLEGQTYKWKDLYGRLQVQSEEAILSTNLPLFKSVLTLTSGRAQVIWFFGGLFLIVVVAVLVRSLANQIVLLDVERPAQLDASYFESDDLKRDLLIIGPPGTGKSEIYKGKQDTQIVDLADTSKFKTAEALHTIKLARDKHILVLDHFGFNSDQAEWNSAKMGLLQRFCMMDRKRLKQIVLICTEDPLQFTQKPAHRRPDAEEEGKEEKDSPLPSADDTSVFSTWDNVLGTFLRISHRDYGDPDEFKATLAKREDIILKELDGLLTERENTEEQSATTPDNEQAPLLGQKGIERKKNNVRDLCTILREECISMSILQKIGKQLASLRNFAEFRPEELRSLILEWAEPQYNAMWKASRPNEKLLLSQLAKEGFVHFDTENPKALRNLLRNGLMVRKPELRLMNESFRAFLLTSEIQSEVKELIRKRGSSTWNKLKMPLLTVLIGVSLFLFITQQDVFNNTLAWLSAIAAGLPALFRVFSMVQGNASSGGE